MLASVESVPWPTMNGLIMPLVIVGATPFSLSTLPAPALPQLLVELEWMARVLLGMPDTRTLPSPFGLPVAEALPSVRIVLL